MTTAKLRSGLPTDEVTRHGELQELETVQDPVAEPRAAGVQTLVRAAQAPQALQQVFNVPVPIKHQLPT